jgi:hypothetical protein
MLRTLYQIMTQSDSNQTDDSSIDPADMSVDGRALRHAGETMDAVTVRVPTPVREHYEGLVEAGEYDDRTAAMRAALTEQADSEVTA